MPIPRDFGPYEILRVLDRGGMGNVYLAREREGLAAGRLVVVKTIRSELERSAVHVMSFQREARLLAHFRHPNIVQLYDAGRLHGRLYMAMEYLEGLDLSKVLYLQALASTTLPLEVTVAIGMQVALALDGAHAYESEPGKRAGLVHRDLSPHNVFLLSSGGVKILDFGLARAYGEISTTRTGTVKGKFRYLAPEQARGEKLDARVDIFSLGLVLHEMLSGQRAYDQHADVDVLRVAMAGEVKRLRDIAADRIPEPLISVVEHALAPCPDDRYPSALALAEALERAAAVTGLGHDPSVLRRFMSELGDPNTLELPSEMYVGLSAEYLDATMLQSVDGQASSIASVADVGSSKRRLATEQPPNKRVPWLVRAGLTTLFALLGGVAFLYSSTHVAKKNGFRAGVLPAAASSSTELPSTPGASSTDITQGPDGQPSLEPSTAVAPSSSVGSTSVSPMRDATGPHRGSMRAAPEKRVIKPKRGVGLGVVRDYPR